MKSAVSVIGCLVVSCAPVEQGEDSWASAGFSATVAKELTGRVEQMLGDAIADGAFPGAVALISRHGRPLVHVAAGTETYERGSKKVTRRSLFDLASLTKVCATGPAVLRLVMAGKLFKYPALRRVFMPGDELPSGDLLNPPRFRQTELADVPDAIARGSADAFYRGDVAAAICSDIGANGGVLSEEDLVSYEPLHWPNGLEFAYRGHTEYAFLPTPPRARPAP